MSPWVPLANALLDIAETGDRAASRRYINQIRETHPVYAPFAISWSSIQYSMFLKDHRLFGWRSDHLKERRNSENSNTIDQRGHV